MDSQLERLVSRLFEYDTIGFDARDFISPSKNIILEADEDFGVFEYDYSGVYTGHYFFRSKGKAAIARSKEFLNKIFEIAEVVKGLVPVDHLGSKWLTRHLGFKSYGIISVDKPYELFIMTKQEWNNI